MTKPNSPRKVSFQLSKWFSDLDWRVLLFTLPLLSFLLFFSFSAVSFPSSSSSAFTYLSSFTFFHRFSPPSSDHDRQRKKELDRARIAVCLVGGARRFELTGPSILENILEYYPNSDLFLHSPFDSDSYKFSLLKTSPRIAAVRIFTPAPINETESDVRVLTASNSPNGIQGLLQYFKLVEGCITLIKAHQAQNNFTYDWIVRTRVDSYWASPLRPDNFIGGKYLVPPGSSYGGLNDRLGVGDFNTSVVALSRHSLIPQLDSAGLRQLNSESAFKAQLTTTGVPYLEKRTPFCIVSDRKYSFPPGVPVAAMSSPGPLSGAKCRPCKPVCTGECVMKVMNALDKRWSWTDWENGSLELCDAHGDWETGWEEVFDRTAGKRRVAARKQVAGMKLKQCVEEFEELRLQAVSWDAPPANEVCGRGLKMRV